MQTSDIPKTIKIAKIIDEAKDIKTFVFNEKLAAKPGQYIMLWIPGVNEKPFSIAYQDRTKFAITVCAIGEFSKKLHGMKEGDIVGIRGPYGNYFKLGDAKTKSIVLVGGGYGSAPLSFLANNAKFHGYDVHFIIGARTKDYLLFEDRMKRSNVRLHYCTDDGSYGFKGFTTQLLEKIIEQHNGKSAKAKNIKIKASKKDAKDKPRMEIGKIFVCGPDMMEKKVIEIAEKYDVPCEISMERYMKCGTGICGNCCVDYKGLRVCRDGPVFDAKIAKHIVDLGNYKRDAKGSKVMFKK
ncbi:MAG: dihydroorotate dehydrogenase electron transfer subunit [Nanoarchaeota archaeon]|nr:dihydroorotate dehydrogenase electron transfer subunit [Nanoarchaeota archaeon]